MPEKIATTHVVLPRQLIVYRRGNSGAFQCRYKCDGKWQRTTTKEVDFQKAIERAKRLLIEAEVRLASNIPVITRRFRDVARLAIERMEHELANGKRLRLIRSTRQHHFLINADTDSNARRKTLLPCFPALQRLKARPEC